MKKILMLIPVLCFTLCIAAVIRFQSAAPALPSESVPSAPTAPSAAATMPTLDSAAETLPTGPLRAALPLDPADPEFCANLFFPVEIKNSPNHELQYYHPDQLQIDGNRLIFTADRSGGDYLSARAESMVSFRYGSITLRVQTVKTPGFFPAVWMLPVSGALLPEVDIYESLGRQPELIYGVLHFPHPETGNRERIYFRHYYPDPANLPESVEIRFDWTPEAMTWYLNGEEIFRNTSMVPQEPMFLILNLAVGGDFCHDPAPDVALPVTFEAEILEFSPLEIYTR